MLVAFIIILVLSFVFALRSMKDFDVPQEVNRVIASKKLKGTIIFFKDKINHYKN